MGQDEILRADWQSAPSDLKTPAQADTQSAAGFHPALHEIVFDLIHQTLFLGLIFRRKQLSQLFE